MADIPALTKHFILKYSKIFNKKVSYFSRSAITALETYDYPGNVRELENVIERSVALADGNTIEIYDLPKEIVSKIGLNLSNESVPIYVGDSIETAEKKLIIATLEHCNYNKRQTAKILEMSERHLYNKLNHYNFESE
jgi:two-component system response regulator AtoC